MTTDPETDLRCSRVRLLLSLAADGEATPDQQTEIDAHLPTCADCRSAQAADVAVRDRLSVQASVPSGFADRVAARVSRQRLEARAQNRFLMGAAAAAVLVAGIASFTLPSGPSGPRGDGGTPVAHTARDTAGSALRTTLAVGRAPRMGAEDR